MELQVTDKIYELYQKEDEKLIRNFCLSKRRIQDGCDELADLIGVDEYLNEEEREELSSLFFDQVTRELDEDLYYLF